MSRAMLRIAIPAAVACAALAAALPLTAAPTGDRFTVTSLVSDTGTPAQPADPDLVNAWGLARSGTSPWWVADNGRDKSTLYNASGGKRALTVAVDGGPTGVVFAGI